MLPVGDLIAAGLYDPSEERITALGEEGSPPLASLELARAQARISALEDLVSRQDDELKFLRQLTSDTLSHRAS